MAKEERAYSEVLLLAQLTIEVDRYIRETGIAKPKPRSIDAMLSDVGVKTSDIANLLGKSERAVFLQLAANTNMKKKTRAKTDSKVRIDGTA